MSRQARAAAAGFALVLLSGCGYALVGRGDGGVIPPEIRVIAVVPFENMTNRPEIEQRITEEIANEMSRRRRYTVVTDPAAADAMLEGAVTSFRTNPVQFTQEGRTTRVEAVVTIRATLRDLRNDEVLWNQSGLLFREQYEAEFIGPEVEALDEIASGAAGALVAALLEGF